MRRPILVAGAWLLAFSIPCAAQTVVASASVLCGVGQPWETTSGPIVGAIINQTSTTITDLEVELSIITRDKKGNLKRQRDTRFVVVPSLNQTGMVTKLEQNGDVYFSIPGKEKGLVQGEFDSDMTCGFRANPRHASVLNVAAIAVTRINGKSVLPMGKKQAPLDFMLQVPHVKLDHQPTPTRNFDPKNRVGGTAHCTRRAPLRECDRFGERQGVCVIFQMSSCT